MKATSFFLPPIPLSSPLFISHFLSLSPHIPLFSIHSSHCSGSGSGVLCVVCGVGRDTYPNPQPFLFLHLFLSFLSTSSNIPLMFLSFFYDTIPYSMYVCVYHGWGCPHPTPSLQQLSSGTSQPSQDCSRGLETQR